MYWRALDNIKSLIKGDTPIGITVTVSDYNVAELYEITEMFMELGVKKTIFVLTFCWREKIQSQSIEMDRNSTTICVIIRS